MLITGSIFNPNAFIQMIPKASLLGNMKSKTIINVRIVNIALVF